MAREQINRGRLRAQIEIQPMEEATVCIFCPTEVSEKLYQHLTTRHILSTTPRRAMFGRYPQDELIVTLSLEEALAEVKEFVGSLPEICYERAAASYEGS